MNNTNTGNKISREIHSDDDTSTLIKRIEEKIPDFKKHKENVEHDKEEFRDYIKSFDGKKVTESDLKKQIKQLQDLIASQNDLIEFYDDMNYLWIHITKRFQAKEADLHRRWKEKMRHQNQSK